MSHGATSKIQYSLAEAYHRAILLIDLLRPACERIEIAGSIRRKSGAPHIDQFGAHPQRGAMVGDIEICCVPRIVERQGQLFESGKRESAVDLLVDQLTQTGGNFLWKSDKRKADGPRYKRLVYRGIPVDLFCVMPPAQWGVIFALRTGPSDWSKALVTQRKKGGLCPDNCYVRDGQFFYSGNAQPCPEEHHFFSGLGLPHVPPHQRTDAMIERLRRR